MDKYQKLNFDTVPVSLRYSGHFLFLTFTVSLLLYYFGGEMKTKSIVLARIFGGICILLFTYYYNVIAICNTSLRVSYSVDFASLYRNELCLHSFLYSPLPVATLK